MPYLFPTPVPKPSGLNSGYLSQHSPWINNNLFIIIHHHLSFYNMLGAAEDIKKMQFMPWGLHSDRQTNKLYLRRGRLIAEMQFPRCLYLCFGFICLLTSCGPKKSLNFPQNENINDKCSEESTRLHMPSTGLIAPTNQFWGSLCFWTALSQQFLLPVASSLETKSLF